MSRLRKMNSRGDIPVTILVIGVFVVCAAALISFYGARVKINNSFEGVSLVEQMNAEVEIGDTSNLVFLGGRDRFYLEILRRPWWQPWKDKIKVFSVRFPRR